jgi:hypothetical protein
VNGVEDSAGAGTLTRRLTSVSGGASGGSAGSAGVPPCPAGLTAYGPSDIDLTSAPASAVAVGTSVPRGIAV